MVLKVAERLGTYIRVWGKGNISPVGTGFLVDQNHIMTCGHVVGDALGDRTAHSTGSAPVDKLIRIDFPCDERSGDERAYFARPLANAWHPQNGDQRPSDVAVLKIEPGKALPKDAIPVWACVAMNVGDPVTAYGIKENLPEGTNVTAVLADSVRVDRLEITALTIDTAVGAGCSGAGLWNVARRGLAGMIVEMQSGTQGRIIPVDELQKVWPIRRPESDMYDQVVEGRTFASLSSRLLEVLYTFDRELQGAEFDIAMDTMWEQERRPIICAIIGTDEDRPFLCRDRCLYLGLKERLERIEIGKPPTLGKIAWPEQGRPAEQRLIRLKHQVRNHLKATDYSPAEIRKKYNAGVAPWAFFTVVEHTFNRECRELLIHWHAFWQEVGAEPLNKPLALFFLFQNDGTEREGFSLNGFFSELGNKPFEAICPLPRLNEFDPAEVNDWLRQQAGALDIRDEDLRERILPHVAELVKSKTRLSTLQSVVASLRHI